MEREEELLMGLENLKIEEQDNLISQDKREAYQDIKRKKHAFREEHALKRGKTALTKNKSMSKFKEVLEGQGLDASLVEERMRNRSRSRSLAEIKAKRGGDMEDEEREVSSRVRDRIREASRSRSKGFKRELSVQ
jgi:thymidine phosphorylase